VRDDVIRLIGTYEPIGVKKRVIKVVKSVSKLRTRKIMLTALGSFYEAEAWIEAPPEFTLGKAHEVAMRIARSIVSSVSEIIRALIIVVLSEHESIIPITARARGARTIKKNTPNNSMN